MALALIVVVLGTLFGASAYASQPVMIAATAGIAGWLLVFHLRERAARARRR